MYSIELLILTKFIVPDYIIAIKQKLHIDLERVNIGQRAKGQLISKCLYGVIVSTKNPTNFF